MDPFYWAILGVCLTIGICALALVVFVIIFCRVRIQDDTNVRKRIITKKAFNEEEAVVEPAPVRPQFDPGAVSVPIVFPPPPPPVIVPTPMPVPIPVQPRPPPEPKVIVREIIRENPQPPVDRVVRRRSWSGVGDDWLLVKKVKKRKGGNVKKSKSSGSDSSSDSSSDDDDARPTRPQRPLPMVPVRYGVQRLDPYDLAVPANPLYATRPPVPGVVGMIPAPTANVIPVQPQVVVQPTTATAMMMPTMQAVQPTYMPMMMPPRM